MTRDDVGSKNTDSIPAPGHALWIGAG